MALIINIANVANTVSQYTIIKPLTFLQTKITLIARVALGLFVLGLLVRIVRRGFNKASRPAPSYRHQYQHLFNQTVKPSFPPQNAQPQPSVSGNGGFAAKRNSSPIHSSPNLSPVSTPRGTVPVARPAPVPVPSFPFKPVISQKCQIALDQTKTRLPKTAVFPLGLSLDDHVSFIDQLEKKINKLKMSGGPQADIDSKQTELTQYLLSYNETFWQEMIGIFSQGSLKLTMLIKAQGDIAFFTGMMEMFPAETQFLVNSFEKMEEFNKNCFFTSTGELILDETKTNRFAVLNPFLSVTNHYFPFIQFHNPHLAQDLKIKAANFPVHIEIDRQKEFPNLYLTEAEILHILIAHFVKVENDALDALVQNGSLHHLSAKDYKRMEKYVKDSSTAQTNRDRLKGFYSSDAIQNNQDAEKLYYAFCAKKFFLDQIGLPEKDLFIPRWDHTTRLEYILSIIGDGMIKVMHLQQFNGAWLSTMIEDTMGAGQSVLVFTSHVQKIDPEVVTKYQYGAQKKWRGSQNPIPLMGKTSPHLAMIGVYEKATKQQKAEILQKARGAGHLNVSKIYRHKFIKFMQTQIGCAIGHPNLNERWFGKDKLDDLEKSLKAGQNQIIT